MGGKLEAPEGKLLCWLNPNSGEQGIGPKLVVNNFQIYKVFRSLPGESRLPPDVFRNGYTVFDVGTGEGVVVVNPQKGGYHIKSGVKRDLGVFKVSGT